MDTLFQIKSSELDEVYVDLLDSQVEVVADNLEEYSSPNLPDGIPDGTVGKVQKVNCSPNAMEKILRHNIAIVWNIDGKKVEWTYVREDKI